MVKSKPLYLASSFDELQQYVETDVFKDLRRIDKIPHAAHRLLTELFSVQDDQEKVYIIGKRYLKLMDYYFKHQQDKNFCELRYGNEYHQIQKLLADLERELRERYEAQVEEVTPPGSIKESSGYIKPGVYQTPSRDSGYLKPGLYTVAADIDVQSTEGLETSTLDYGPSQLFRDLMTEKDLLIVDIRSPEEFQESQIVLNQGKLINIPANLIEPGLSANTLGQRLDIDTKDVWNKRDEYDFIVLLDFDTDNFNYSGSRLERLKQCIVEWDFNKTYKHEPVFLKGGFKEFLEWYPSEVSNPQAYLSRTNSEIDELLTMDEVAYPEAGSSSGKMNLNIHTLSIFGDIQTRIKRDFGDTDTFGPPARPSRSEGQLPKDFYSYQEKKSPYKSISEESLGNEYTRESLDLLPEGDKLLKIRTAIEGDRAELLKEARALKPKSDGPPVDEPKDIIIRNLIEENKDNQEIFSAPIAPVIDRSFKPAQVQEVVGEGYTGIKNIRNNCYVSCMLQCLKVLPLIKYNFVTSNEYLKFIEKKSPTVTHQFASVMKKLWEGTFKRHRSYNPQVFLEKVYELNPVYEKGNHEDTFEFFMFLFSQLSEDCSFELPRPQIMTEREKSWYSQLGGRSSYFIDLMHYQLKNTKVCWRCQKPNYTFDNDNTLMLPIPEKRENCNLEYMLKEYMKENLVVDYSCVECKTVATIVNIKDIVQDPAILIILLKRYMVIGDGSYKKDEANISFPINDLHFGNSIYKLYAIPQHSGSMVAGHYYASVLLNDEKNHWVLFNDERIMKYSCPISEVQGIKSSCVGFFYVSAGSKKPI